MSIQDTLTRCIPVVVFALLATATSTIATADTSGTDSPTHTWYNGDQVLPVWFAEDTVAVISESDTAETAAARSPSDGVFGEPDW